MQRLFKEEEGLNDRTLSTAIGAANQRRGPKVNFLTTVVRLEVFQNEMRNHWIKTPGCSPNCWEDTCSFNGPSVGY